MRVVEVYDEFVLAARAANRSPRTIDSYKWHVRRFISFLERSGVPDDCEAFTASVFRQYIAELQEAAYAPQTVTNNVKALKALFAFAVQDELLEQDPTRRVAVPKVPKLAVDTFTTSDVDTLLRACDTKTVTGARDFAVVLTLFDTAVRASELVNLRDVDIDYQRELIKVYGKGAKERFVPASARTLRALRRYQTRRDKAGHGGSSYLFVNNVGQPLTRSGLNQLLERLGDRTGLHVYPHKFRHSFAVVSLRNGAREYDIQACLGHTTLTMTRHYARQSTEDISAAHKRFSPADKLKVRL